MLGTVFSVMMSLLERWTTPLDPDAYLASLAPLWGGRPRGVVDRVTSLTESSALIRIRPGRSWRPHRPGQFVTVGVEVDGRRHHRCYSITSLPCDGRGRDPGVELGVQATDGGVVSNHLVHAARRGDVVQLGVADGDFVLPETVPQRLLFVTGGSGITPVVGMLRWLEATAPSSDVVLLHHVSDPARLMFASELERWSAVLPRLRVVLTDTGTGGGRHLDQHRLDAECPDWRDRETFVCGPEGLAGFAVDHWAGAGLERRLHLERFTPRVPRGEQRDGASTPSTASAATVSFTASGVAAECDSATPLLDVAEAAGLHPPSGCRMGICHTCTTRLDCGSVVDLRDGRIHEAGEHVQLCVSAALYDVTLDR
jgi:ferredoxin-NADP reductase